MYLLLTSSVLGLSVLSCLQPTQVLAAPSNGVGGNVSESLISGNHSIIPRDSENSNSTSSNALHRPPPVTDKPPTEEFCDSNTDCDFGYKCKSGMCTLGCDDRTDCIPHYHRCVKGQCSWKFEGRKKNEKCWTYKNWCWFHNRCCSGYCSKGFCARLPREQYL